MEYEASDKRIYIVTCFYCHSDQEMLWPQVSWENDDPETGHYSCVHCKKPWSEKDRLQAISGGRFEATAPFKGHAGFKINKLASPWEDIPRLVEKYLHAKDRPELMKTFVNTQLAETYEEKGDAPEWNRLYERRSNYKINSIPKNVVFLTAGVDIQKDRIEIQIIGWGEEKRSWVVDYRVYMGDTSDLNSHAWVELSKLLSETWKKDEYINLGIERIGIDTGYNTQVVYSWCRKYNFPSICAMKGQESIPVIVGQPRAVDVNYQGRRFARGLKVWPVGVNIVKSETYAWLKQDSPTEEQEPPHGFCYFPELESEFFKQLTAEQLVTKIHRGYPKPEWKKIYERNEVLDTRVYARAAATIFGIDRFTEDEWTRLKTGSAFSSTFVQNKPKRTKIKRKRSNFW